MSVKRFKHAESFGWTSCCSIFVMLLFFMHALFQIVEVAGKLDNQKPRVLFLLHRTTSPLGSYMPSLQMC